MSDEAPQDAPENPYASPASAAEAEPAQVEHFGHMPGSVKLAIGSLLCWIAMLAIFLTGVISAGGPQMVAAVLAVLLASGVACAVGLWRRHLLARACARVMGMGLGLLIILLVAMGIVSWATLWSDPEFQAHMQPVGAPELLLTMLLGPVACVFPAALLLAVFFSLGQTSARAYFGLICPSCHQGQLFVSGPTRRERKCCACGHVWSPPARLSAHVMAG